MILRILVLLLVLSFLFIGCHNFIEDPDGYSVYERCAVCGDTYDGGWHYQYDQGDPDRTITAIESEVLRGK
jgi:hypothetical protein